MRAAHVHGAGIGHRDLQPDNVIVRPDGSPVLVDFGVADEPGGEVSREALVVEPGAAGTLPYMAKEQLRGDLVDARADLSPLGCMFSTELVVGVPPFRAMSPSRIGLRPTSFFGVRSARSRPLAPLAAGGPPPLLPPLWTAATQARRGRAAWDGFPGPGVQSHAPAVGPASPSAAGEKARPSGCRKEGRKASRIRGLMRLVSASNGRCEEQRRERDQRREASERFGRGTGQACWAW